MPLLAAGCYTLVLLHRNYKISRPPVSSYNIAYKSSVWKQEASVNVKLRCAKRRRGQLLRPASFTSVALIAVVLCPLIISHVLFLLLGWGGGGDQESLVALIHKAQWTASRTAAFISVFQLPPHPPIPV